MVKYRGGKSKETRHLIKHIPQYNGIYIEPFFGGGALFFHLEPKRAIINDINSKLISFYLGVKNDFDTQGLSWFPQASLDRFSPLFHSQY